ncbi:MAG: hypothetical protein K1X88_12725 [Nannocystaceae bacterium]|nr:hypothetical protein [Nannocystaceae bacterium]
MPDVIVALLLDVIVVALSSVVLFVVLESPLLSLVVPSSPPGHPSGTDESASKNEMRWY